MFVLYFIILLFICSILFFFLMIRRPPRSTLSSSSAASDVYKRQVRVIGGGFLRECSSLMMLNLNPLTTYIQGRIGITSRTNDVDPNRGDRIIAVLTIEYCKALKYIILADKELHSCLLYTSPSPRVS
eukprot:TRINITY_DN10217_c0_g1_i1.p1 TRINITY_DN10217_c0_g1~~TRINITY_DN10217_c0_g1_i1.p1  ORF type:complete len:128 (+),score=22.56 TRINITY_DN10217_c0_g1_i1:69-452(+)